MSAWLAGQSLSQATGNRIRQSHRRAGEGVVDDAESERWVIYE